MGSRRKSAAGGIASLLAVVLGSSGCVTLDKGLGAMDGVTAVCRLLVAPQWCNAIDLLSSVVTDAKDAAQAIKDAATPPPKPAKDAKPTPTTWVP